MAQSLVAPRINISMVSLKWGDVLSTVLPGAVAVFAIAPWFPPLWAIAIDLNHASLATGIGLLGCAALAGGILEAITRIAWEPFWLTKRCKNDPLALTRLTPETLELYERGVQSSYKYVTFYANLAWAAVFLLVSYLWHSPNVSLAVCLLLTATVGILLRASHVQWTYFVNYQSKVFRAGAEDVRERSASGNAIGHGDAGSQGHSDAGSLRSGHTEAAGRTQDGTAERSVW